MRNIYTTLKYCILIPLLASCSVLDEDGLADGVGGNPSNAVYMGNVNRTGVIAVLASDQDGASFAITPRLANATDVPVTVTVEVDVATLEKYNEENGLNVRPVSPEDIRFVNAEGEVGTGKISATIKPGNIVATIEGRLMSLDATKYPYDGRYAIPVKITDVKGPLKLLSSPVTTIVNLNRKIKTSVFHMRAPGGGGYTMRFAPKVPYKEEMSEWTFQYIAQFNNIHGNNQTTGSLSSSAGFYNRISKTAGLQVKSEGRDGVDTWTNKPVNEGEWLHVSYVYRRSGLVGKLSVYVNGELQKTFTTSRLYIDNKEGSGWGFGNENVRDYYLREVRYWNRALTGAEILDKYYLPEDPQANGLEAYFPMTKESYDEKSKTFTDLTGKWTWTIRENADYEITEDVVFPAQKLKIEKNEN
ncbi:LamG-like jellyroll fold domain-containing protein [Bacteroides pyogenes]|uniref:LamG-like jellyroll fold domain-containing protein n=1 Tax=Bacteroides pyogenes TaxID=310300 RepID=UPI003B4300CA